MCSLRVFVSVSPNSKFHVASETVSQFHVESSVQAQGRSSHLTRPLIRKNAHFAIRPVVQVSSPSAMKALQGMQRLCGVTMFPRVCSQMASCRLRMAIKIPMPRQGLVRWTRCRRHAAIAVLSRSVLRMSAQRRVAGCSGWRIMRRPKRRSLGATTPPLPSRIFCVIMMQTTT